MSTTLNGSSYYLVIVGRSDNPIYELEYCSKSSEKNSDNRYLSQFIAHSSLDLIDEYLSSPTNNNMYLKTVDKFNEFMVNAFVCATSTIKFLLLHDVNKIDEASFRSFFVEIYELYTKYCLNPFYEHHTPIKSPVFDKKILTLAKKYLPWNVTLLVNKNIYN